jgi:hypothetical protein
MLGFTETGYYERVEHLSKAKACCSYLVCNYDTFAVQSNVCLGLAGASFLGIRCTVHCYMHGLDSAESALGYLPLPTVWQASAWHMVLC